MKLIDIVNMALINFKRQIYKNISIIVILTSVVIVFNITYSLVGLLKDVSSSNITDNQNLKIIEVTTIEEEISINQFNEFEKLEHVNNIFYNYCIGCSIEYDNQLQEMNVVGMSSEQSSKLVKEDIELEDYQIILNSKLESEGFKIGQKVRVSYNAMVTDSQGMRMEKDYTVIGFYEQPKISSWYDNVGIVSQNCMYEICGSLYGMRAEEIENSNLYKQSVLLFVDNIDYVKSIAEYIENKGFIVSYALLANDKLPAMAKIILGIGFAITVILVLFSFIVINTSINNAIKERYREIGILKTIGVNEKNLFVMMYLELILLWCVIAIISVILSVVAIYGISNIPIIGNMKEIRISVMQLLMSIVFCLCIIVITTYATVKKTSKLKIVEVLKYE